MPIKTLLLILLLFLLNGDGKKEGRRGNALYQQEKYEEAAQVYQDGLARYEEPGPDATYAGLLNNLGAALHKQGDFEGAQNALNGGHCHGQYRCRLRTLVLQCR